MSAVVYQTERPATPPAGVEIETEDVSGAKRQVVKIGGATDINTHTGSTEIRTFAESHVCTNNSSRIPLAGGATFAGGWQDAINYSEILVTIYTDKTSATDGLKVWWSSDGINVDPDPDTYTITANVSKTFSFPRNRRYVKVTLTNGASAQTFLDLSTILSRYASKGSSHRLKDNLSEEDDAIVTKTQIAGFSTAGGGSVVNVKVNPSGAVQVGGTIDGITGTVVTTRADNLYNDAFQRLRVSNTDQRFDSEFIYDKSPLLFDDISAGGGSTTFQANSRDVVLATGGTGTGVSAGLRQHWANIYTSGNSQFIILTGTLNGANLAGGRAEVFLRSSVTGSVTEEIIADSTWLASTASIDWSDSHIFIMDFQSLRVGKIRFGMDRGGLAVAMAQITNDNKRATGYWQTANQPVYWRQYNTASYTYTEIGYGDETNAIGFRYRIAVNGSQTMRAICSTVKSEGGGDIHDVAGIRYGVGNGVTRRSVTSTTNFLPVLSIQLKATLNTYPVKSIVFPKEIEMTADNAAYYEVRINPVLTGASFASVGADSVTNVDVAATAVTGGRVIKSGYVVGGTSSIKGTADHMLTSKIPLGVSAAGVGDILSICFVKDSATNASLGCTLVFEEVR